MDTITGVGNNHRTKWTKSLYIQRRKSGQGSGGKH